MLCDMDQVTAMRFILRQPSPVWLHFTIEDLQIFPPGQKVSRCQAWAGGQDMPLSPALYLAFALALGSTHRDVGPSPCPLLGHLGSICAPVMLGKGLL